MKRLNNFAIKLILLSGTALALNAHAAVYSRPSSDDSLIGRLQNISIEPTDTSVTIAKRYDVGQNSISNANPQYNLKQAFPLGGELQIPTYHLLPDTASRNGIVVNLPEMRIYFYDNDSNQIITYPIGIGKIGKTIPIQNAVVTRKKENPTWTPPKDIRDFNLEQGIVLPKVMPAGPDNPLGPYAVYMSIPTYLMHSTPFPESVGKRASFGCLRMYEWDIEQLFPKIKSGIPIQIINSPIKLGWENSNLYIEAHPPLEEHADAGNASLPHAVSRITNMVRSRPILVDWQGLSYIMNAKDGIPHRIGVPLMN